MVDINNLPSWPSSPSDCPDGSHSSGTVSYNGETWFRLGTAGQVMTNCDMWMLVNFYKDFMYYTDINSWWNWNRVNDYSVNGYGLIAWFVYRLKILSDPRIPSGYDPRYKVSPSDLQTLENQFPFNWDDMVNQAAAGSNDAYSAALRNYEAANPGWSPESVTITGGTIWPPYTSSVTTNVNVSNGGSQTVSGSSILSITINQLIGGGGGGGGGDNHDVGQAGGSGGAGGVYYSYNYTPPAGTTSVTITAGIGGDGSYAQPVPDGKTFYGTAGGNSGIYDQNGNGLIVAGGGGGGTQGMYGGGVGGSGGSGQFTGASGTTGSGGNGSHKSHSHSTATGENGADCSISVNGQTITFGTGGTGGAPGQDATSGTGYGAGGGSSGVSDNSNKEVWNRGGSGAPGHADVNVTYVP